MRQNKPPKRITRLQELQSTLDGRLSRHTQVTYAIAFYERWNALRTSSHHEDKTKSIIPSHYFWADVVKLHLHWLLYQAKDSFYKYYDIPATTANRLHKWIREIVYFLLDCY